MNCLTACLTLPQSARSSYLSLIELTRNMTGRPMHLQGNVDDLPRHMKQIWREIPQETFSLLQHSRLEVAAAAGGGGGGGYGYPGWGHGPYWRSSGYMHGPVTRLNADYRWGGYGGGGLAASSAAAGGGGGGYGHPGWGYGPHWRSSGNMHGPVMKRSADYRWGAGYGHPGWGYGPHWRSSASADSLQSNPQSGQGSGAVITHGARSPGYGQGVQFRLFGSSGEAGYREGADLSAAAAGPEGYGHGGYYRQFGDNPDIRFRLGYGADAGQKEWKHEASERRRIKKRSYNNKAKKNTSNKNGFDAGYDHNNNETVKLLLGLNDTQFSKESKEEDSSKYQSESAKLILRDESNGHKNNTAHNVGAFFDSRSNLNDSQGRASQNSSSTLMHAVKMNIPIGKLNNDKSGSEKYEKQMQGHFEGSQDKVVIFDNERWETGHAVNSKPQLAETSDARNGYKISEIKSIYVTDNSGDGNDAIGAGLNVQSGFYNDQKNEFMGRRNFGDYYVKMKDESYRHIDSIEDDTLESTLYESDNLQNSKIEAVGRNEQNPRIHRRSASINEPYIPDSEYEILSQAEGNDNSEHVMGINNAPDSEQQQESLTSDYESAEEVISEKRRSDPTQVDKLKYLSSGEYVEHERDYLQTRDFKRNVHSEGHIGEDVIDPHNEDAIVSGAESDSDPVRENKRADYIQYRKNIKDVVSKNPISKSKHKQDGHESSSHGKGEARSGNAADHVLNETYLNNNGHTSEEADRHVRSVIEASYEHPAGGSEYGLNLRAGEYGDNTYDLSSAYDNSEIGYRSFSSGVGFENNAQVNGFDNNARINAFGNRAFVNEHTDQSRTDKNAANLGYENYNIFAGGRGHEPRAPTLFESKDNEKYNIGASVKANGSPDVGHISSIQGQKTQNVQPYNDFGSSIEVVRSDTNVHGGDNIARIDNFKNIAPGIVVKTGANIEGFDRNKFTSHEKGNIHLSNEKGGLLKTIGLSAGGGVGNYRQGIETMHYNSGESGFQKDIRNQDIRSRNDEYLEKELPEERHGFKRFRRYLESKASGNTEKHYKSNNSAKEEKENDGDVIFDKLKVNADGNSEIHKISSSTEKYGDFSKSEINKDASITTKNAYSNSKTYKDIGEVERLNREPRYIKKENSKAGIDISEPGEYPSVFFEYGGATGMLNNNDDAYDAPGGYRNFRGVLYGGNEYENENTELGEELSSYNSRANPSIDSINLYRNNDNSEIDKGLNTYGNKPVVDKPCCGDKKNYGNSEATAKAESKAVTRGLESDGMKKIESARSYRLTNDGAVKEDSSPGSENLKPVNEIEDEEEATEFKGSRRLLMHDEDTNTPDSFYSSDEGYSDAIYGEPEIPKYRQGSHHSGHSSAKKEQIQTKRYSDKAKKEFQKQYSRKNSDNMLADSTYLNTDEYDFYPGSKTVADLGSSSQDDQPFRNDAGN
ncbi:hypothetical protein TNCV_3182282 [Trichonephila clavipes]|uniref:Uncharacterized protein n=1 Tax=Trichonephila clavipes TaxID=2585209 RepID=A0A8X6SFP8_TRICX|nr:hypothetical protein TNCV_3182282 [Trichonephila clavipes]